MNIKIKKIYNYFPKKIETLTDLCKINKDWNKKTILEKTGVNKKRISRSNETIQDLIKGLKKKYKKINELNNCGLMILVTQTPHSTIPSNIHLFQKIFKIKHSAIAFDINQGCSGYLYGLATADSLMQKFKTKTAAIITCDTYSKFISKNNRSCRTVFGDALTLTIVEKTNKKHFLDYSLGSDCSGFDNFKLESNEIKMNGSEMYNFARQSVPTEVEKILKKTKIKKENVKFFIFHQASKLILETLQKSIGISKDKLFVNINEVGNTTSSSIPLAIQSLMNKKKIKKNDILLLSGFGVGYSWGTCLYKN